jgi:LAS superfamily LD-carboxypeptidase LdcB
MGENCYNKKMKKWIDKNFGGKIDWTILATILLGLGFFGAFFYTNYRYLSISKEIEDKNTTTAETLAALDVKIKDLGDILERTLTSEQKKNRSLRNDLEDITHNVANLERISTTDRDLLKKYSKTYFLNENYTPLDLDSISDEFRSPSASNYKILSDVAPNLEDLFMAAQEDGLHLLAQSAYRSFGTQSALKASYVITYGAGTANSFSADQGYSEHQLGTALDFTTESLSGGLEGFDKTPEYTWLLANAYKYGFIISYPASNAYYKFEPWHWRFVGKDLAEKLHDEHLNFYDLDQRVIDTYLSKIFN